MSTEISGSCVKSKGDNIAMDPVDADLRKLWQCLSHLDRGDNSWYLLQEKCNTSEEKLLNITGHLDVTVE